MDIIKKIEQENMRMDMPAFRSGDTVKVHLRIVEGEKQRIQVFQGSVIRLHRGTTGGTFTVRGSGAETKYGVIENPLTITMYNGQNVSGGKVTVQKVDSETKAALSGAVFHVYEWNPKLMQDPAHPGQYISGYYDFTPPHTTTTPYTVLVEDPHQPGFYKNTQRDLVATESNGGKFLIVETKAPTDAYGNTYCAFWQGEIDSLFDHLTWEFTLPDNPATNTPTSVHIAKVDEDGRRLSGIRFAIWEKGHEDQKRERETDEQGMVVLGHNDPQNANASTAIPIKAGKTYCFQETYIPWTRDRTYARLHLDPTVREFTIDALGRVDGNSEATYTIVNFWNSLMTGGEGRMRWYFFACYGVVGLVFVSIVRQRRKNRTAQKR